MKLEIVLEPSDEGGYTVHVPSLPGCISEGDTLEETLANIAEAISLYIEDDAATWEEYLASQPKGAKMSKRLSTEQLEEIKQEFHERRNEGFEFSTDAHTALLFDEVEALRHELSKALRWAETMRQEASKRADRALTLRQALNEAAQERDEARAILAHIAEKLEEHVNDTDLSEYVRVSLAVHMTQARITSQAGKQ